LDAIAVAAIADELKRLVLGGRVQKVVQADELTFGIELYAHHERRWLLLSADPQHARVHLAGEKVGRAGELVSPLLLLLRKHLRHTRLLGVEQPGLERVLALTFGPGRPPGEPDNADEQEPASPPAQDGHPGVTLIIEAIGRYSNLVLVDARGVILDSAKRVTPEINRYRVVLPRHPYVPPPPQDKQPADRIAAADLAARLQAAPAKTAAWQVLVAGYSGVSPQLAREAVHRATGRAGALAGEVASAETLAGSLRELLAPRATGDWRPSVVREGGRVVAFAPYLLTQHRDARPAEMFSAAIDAYYAQVECFRPVDQARDAAMKALAGRREAANRKLESLRRALEGGQKAEQLRRSGEAILAHLADIRRGQTTLAADGLEIQLDPSLTPVENSQACFKRYRKAKAALAGVPALLEETRLYVEYLDQAAAHLALAETVEQVRAVQRDLTPQTPAPRAESGQEVRSAPCRGKPQGKHGRKGASPAAKPSAVGIARHLSGDGIEILVGRTGRQNDAVTFEDARPDDVWLHARGVPGAHVVVRCGPGEVPERTLREAAQLAAHYSASRGATTVPVDWTRRRLVRRIREGLPGLVSYVGERTLHVRPEVPAEVQQVS